MARLGDPEDYNYIAEPFRDPLFGPRIPPFKPSPLITREDFDLFMRKEETSMLDILKYIKEYKDPQTLHSGQTSHLVIDVIWMLTDPRLRKNIIQEMSAKISPVNTVTIVGIETGGAILASLVAEQKNMMYGVYRKDGTLIMPKDTVDKKDVIIIDDVKTTGKSLEEARQALEDKGFHVTAIYTAVDRSDISQ